MMILQTDRQTNRQTYNTFLSYLFPFLFLFSMYFCLLDFIKTLDCILRTSFTFLLLFETCNSFTTYRDNCTYFHEILFS